MTRYLTTALVVPLLVAMGCQSNAVTRKTATVEGLASVQQSINTASIELDKTLASLDRLENTQDLRMSFRDYQGNLKNLSSAQANVRASVNDLQARTNEYMAEWDATTREITDADLRQRSQERADEAREEFDSMLQAGREARDAFDPLMMELNNISTFLTADLTTAGVESVGDAMDRARDQASEARERLNAWQTELNDMRNSWSASGVATGSTSGNSAASGANPTTAPSNMN